MSGPVHLVTRFAGSLVPVGPRRESTEWAESFLLPFEAELWRSQRAADRRHTVAVARRVQAALGAEATRPVMAAALLHDIGKLDSHLGTYLRVMATLSGIAVSHDPDVIKAWTKATGVTRRIGLYLQHPKLGGDMLELGGSDPLTVAWTREHHRPPDEWTIAPEIARALHEADDD